ncbi:dUTP diphosphatase [Candidatus Woesebacteria bacterium]|nr:dUTP diphosphatase [Candidatus Woesebacteria bacterium]
MSPEQIGKLIIKFKKLDPSAIIPSSAHPTDVGFDIYAIEERTLNPGDWHGFSTGLAAEIPKGYFVKFFDKSGLALKSGIHILAGVIDAGYRGEWKVIVRNSGHDPITIGKGEKITQGILMQVIQMEMREVDELSESERGEGGFGSTGKK